MAVGKYRPPKPLQDEDKWGPFTKIQLMCLAPFVAVGLVLGVAVFKAGLYSLGIALMIIGVINGCLFACPNIPTRSYLLGGGLPIRTIAFRVVYRFFHRVLYVTNFDEEKDR